MEKLICGYAESGNVVKSEEMENVEDGEMKAKFERWKSKTYVLFVPLRIVALCNSLPPAYCLNIFPSTPSTGKGLHPCGA
jgi:hypothetical protein